MEGNRTPKKVLYMNLETTRLRGRPRNRWQNEVKGGWKTSWFKREKGKGIEQRGMEEAPENDKESSHSAHANGMNESKLVSVNH
jgi:hypothetical protein